MSVVESPPLMVKTRGRISQEAAARIRLHVDQFLQSGNKGMLILEDGMEAFQLVDGRWSPVGLTPFRIEDEGPHWKIDCRTDLDHATLFDLVDNSTGKPIRGINAVAANDDLGLVLCLRLDEKGDLVVEKGGVALEIRKADFRLVNRASDETRPSS